MCTLVMVLAKPVQIPLNVAIGFVIRWRKSQKLQFVTFAIGHFQSNVIIPVFSVIRKLFIREANHFSLEHTKALPSKVSPSMESFHQILLLFTANR